MATCSEAGLAGRAATDRWSSSIVFTLICIAPKLVRQGLFDEYLKVDSEITMVPLFCWD